MVEETPTNTVTFSGDPADVLPERPTGGQSRRLVVAGGQAASTISTATRRGIMSAIRISEIFGPTVQGEGALIGKPTVFVRTGGCDFRCRWCDTLYAVLPAYRHDWAPMRPEDILARVEELTGGVPVLVTLSGGNPAIQPLGRLIALGKERGHRFAMETQGSVANDWFASSTGWCCRPSRPPPA